MMINRIIEWLKNLELFIFSKFIITFIIYNKNDKKRTITMKIALIDYMSPIGHVSLINFYLKNFENYFNCIFLNKSVKESILPNKKIWYQSFSKFFFFRIFRLIILFNNLKKKNISRVIMLSYEPSVIFFISFLINLDIFQFYIVEHDNINVKKSLKKFFIKNLSKKIIHLTYSKSAEKFLKINLKRKTLFINHPIIKKDSRLKKNSILKSNKKKILIPTRHHLNENAIVKILNKYKNIDFIILLKKSNIKKKKFNNFNNAILLEHISEKDISRVDALYLPVDKNVYKYRVSAWIYRGVAFQKKIILDNNNLFKYEKYIFSNYVCSVQVDFNSLLKFKYNKKNHIKFINNYNSNLISSFKKILTL